MLITWGDNALLRCDVYCYRWNFSSEGVIEKVDGAIGILLLQRVVDMTKADPQVLTWAISRQAGAQGKEDEADAMIDHATVMINKIAHFQKELKEINAGMEEPQENEP